MVPFARARAGSESHLCYLLGPKAKRVIFLCFSVPHVGIFRPWPGTWYIYKCFINVTCYRYGHVSLKNRESLNAPQFLSQPPPCKLRTLCSDNASQASRNEFSDISLIQTLPGCLLPWGWRLSYKGVALGSHRDPVLSRRKHEPQGDEAKSTPDHLLSLLRISVFFLNV